MERLLQYGSEVLNHIHDLILLLVAQTGTPVDDKMLHFWVFGLLGIVIFLASNIVIGCLYRLGIGAVSFIFTTIVLTFLAVAIEVEQRITGRGNMETMDVLAGLAGFLTFFTILMLMAGIGKIIIHLGSKIDDWKRK